MDWQNRKLEIGIGLVGLALFGFMYFSTHQEYKPATGFFKNFEMGFEMPKFRSMLQYFSLEGREIDRQESHEDEISHDGSKPLHDRKMTRPTVSKIENKGRGQKITEDKNKKKVVATSSRTNTQGQRRPVMTVNSHGGGDRYKSAFRSGSQENIGSGDEVVPANASAYVAAQTPEEPAVKKKEDKEQLGLEYWRDMLVKSPTPSTAYKIVEALGKKKISEKDFFTLVEMLLLSKASGYQKLGLYMVYNQSNASAFAVVAKNYDGLQSDLVKTADNYFLSFNDKGKVGVLAGALASNQAKVQVHALNAILTGLQNIRNGQSPGPTEARSQRGGQGSGQVASVDAKSYTQLLPQLQKLAMSSDAQISQTAIQTISLLSSVAGT